MGCGLNQARLLHLLAHMRAGNRPDWDRLQYLLATSGTGGRSCQAGLKY